MLDGFVFSLEGRFKSRYLGFFLPQFLLGVDKTKLCFRKGAANFGYLKLEGSLVDLLVDVVQLLHDRKCGRNAG